jgi:hypothetical protein
MTAQETRYDNTNLPMPMCDGIPEAYRDDIRDLFDTWHSVRARNYSLTRFYTMHNKFVDLGAVKLPKGLNKAKAIVGWPKKAVDVMAVRSKFDGFVMAGKRDPALEAVVSRSKLRSKYAKAARGSLVHGISCLAVDGSGPNTRVRSYSANQSCVIWDKVEDRPACGVVCADVDRKGCASRYVVYEPDAVLTLTRGDLVKHGDSATWEWTCKVEPNPIGRPLIEPLVNDPDDDRPLGHSRITPEVISITEKAMRDVLNMDIASAFWAFPQRYMLGVERNLFADDVVGKATVTDEDGVEVKLKTRMETYLASILALTRDENGQIPTVGQFNPLDPGGLIRVFENDAQRFSGATNVPLGQLGVLSNTYTSSDALGAANDPLILDVETMNTHNRDSLAEIARMVMCAQKRCRPDELTPEEQSVEAYFRDPSQPTLAARADGWTKLAAADNSIVGTRVWYEGLGMDHATIDRLEGEKASQTATDALVKIAESVAGETKPEAQEGPTRRATMYEITSVLGQYKRGQLTRPNALRMLQYIGVEDSEAETLLADVDDGGGVDEELVEEAANGAS